MTPCEKVTLRPGDYVSTRGMSEDDYHAVAEAFMAAGAKEGEYPKWSFARGGYIHGFGWSLDGDLFHSDFEKGFGYWVEHGNDCRHLAIAQVLGTTKQEENPVTAFDTLLVAARKRNEAREELQKAESEFQSALDAANAELGEGFEIRERDAEPEEDMHDPANWRAGDVVKCVRDNWSFITNGHMYQLLSPTNHGLVEIKDNDGDPARYEANNFRFHHRPA